jgi:hypothetical protein
LRYSNKNVCIHLHVLPFAYVSRGLEIDKEIIVIVIVIDVETETETALLGQFMQFNIRVKSKVNLQTHVYIHGLIDCIACTIGIGQLYISTEVLLLCMANIRLCWGLVAFYFIYFFRFMQNMDSFYNILRRDVVTY